MWVFLNLCGSFPICVELGRIKRQHMGAEQFAVGRSSDAPSEAVEALCKARPRRSARLPAPWKKCSGPRGPSRRPRRDGT